MNKVNNGPGILAFPDTKMYPAEYNHRYNICLPSYTMDKVYGAGRQIQILMYKIQSIVHPSSINRLHRPSMRIYGQNLPGATA